MSMSFDKNFDNNFFAITFTAALLAEYDVLFYLKNMTTVVT